MNELRALAAAPLTIPAPGNKNRRCAEPQILTSGLSGTGAMQHPCKSRPQPASLRAAPARRQNLRRFLAGIQTLSQDKRQAGLSV
ncbi:hypothetical protein ABW06_22910 [Pluralibacter gergoviae]|uniref:Uncharacterized protein n=1 Tax=Pluralibacter gergoviae TaxID=61647 RepID=A0A0J5KUC2_PLUGE|nr:hypothetical protein ABW06_22910 [Pluralibacter gergoviae]